MDIRAVDILAALREAIARASTAFAEREDLLARRLVGAAEALNDGVAEAAVRIAGGFTGVEMTQVRAVAAEFRRDDAELARELAARWQRTEPADHTR